jgi:hypothetical protein
VIEELGIDGAGLDQRNGYRQLFLHRLIAQTVGKTLDRVLGGGIGNRKWNRHVGTTEPKLIRAAGSRLRRKYLTAAIEPWTTPK